DGAVDRAQPHHHILDSYVRSVLDVILVLVPIDVAIDHVGIDEEGRLVPTHLDLGAQLRLRVPLQLVRLGTLRRDLYEHAVDLVETRHWNRPARPIPRRGAVLEIDGEDWGYAGTGRANERKLLGRASVIA